MKKCKIKPKRLKLEVKNAISTRQNFLKQQYISPPCFPLIEVLLQLELICIFKGWHAIFAFRNLQ